MSNIKIQKREKKINVFEYIKYHHWHPYNLSALMHFSCSYLFNGVFIYDNCGYYIYEQYEIIHEDGIAYMITSLA